MDKARMIQNIIGAARGAAITEGRLGEVNSTDLFFTLAFKTEDELAAICCGIGIQPDPDAAKMVSVAAELLERHDDYLLGDL